MKIGIVGGRGFNDYESLKKELSKFIEENSISLNYIVSGGAKGADTLAEKFATEMDVEMIVFKPDFEKFGRGAALARNTQIIQKSDVVFAFWDGKSKGTEHSIMLAKRNIKQVYIINF